MDRRDPRRPHRWKRPLDLTILALIVIPAAIVAAGIAGALLVSLGRPVLFRQVRSGRYGRPFTLYKFRTMREPAMPDEPDSERLTPLGALLRSTSLDELPELWNVARGEMSFVGPRPLLMEYLPLYSADQRRRLDALPGLTGWAQVHGRNALTWPERFRHDVWYVDHASVWLDLKILALTLPTVIIRRGISYPGEATMGRFRGER